MLIDPKMSGLPPFLTEDSGVNSGLMIPQVTAAALVSENKSLAFPASVDSIPTSAGQEDHVSMAPIAARKAGQIARNAAGVVAVELIAAAAGRRLPRAAQDQREAAGGSRQGPRDHAALHVATAIGPTKWPRFRRRCWRARSASDAAAAQLTRVQRCSLQSTPITRAALHDHYVRPDLADGRRAADVALGLERPALVDAVAGRAEVAEHPRCRAAAVPLLRALALVFADAQLTVPQ